MPGSVKHRGWFWSKADASNPALVAVLDDTSKSLHICDASDRNTDWNVAADSHPSLYIHSATTPATDYLKLYHDATNAYIDGVGATALKLLIAGTAEVDLTASALSPSTTGGSALGTTALMWANLFLASGAVINFNNGNVTITHSAATLTVDGAAVVFNEASADLDFRIESNDNANMFMLDAGLNAIGIGGVGVASQTLTVTNASLAATAGRVLKLSGSVAAPNHGDGYGAFEVDITASGTIAGTTAASSTWLNIAASAVPGGNLICCQNNGIYLPSGITASSAKMIMGMRMQYVADDGANPGSLFCFSTNIYSNVLTAMFDVNAIADLGGSTGAQTGNDYKIPLFRDATAGQTWYVNVYHT